MTPEAALAEVLAQHAELREMMAQCEDIADALDDDRTSPLHLTRAVARLRVAFAEHNELEERVLRPVLLRGARIEIDRLVAEHVNDHRVMRARLGASTQTAMLRDVIESMRSHLDVEERYLVDAGTVAPPAVLPNRA